MRELFEVVYKKRKNPTILEKGRHLLEGQKRKEEKKTFFINRFRIKR